MASSSFLCCSLTTTSSLWHHHHRRRRRRRRRLLSSSSRPPSPFDFSSSSCTASSSATPPIPRHPSALRLRASPPQQDAPSTSTVDVSVFRFTLGIQGFDDADLPWVIGISVAALILLNHFLSTDSTITPAQWRSEVVGLCSAMVCINLPSIGRVLNGKASSAAQIAPKSSRQVFVLEKDLSPQEKQDLAWASYALLKNSKATSLAVWSERMLCARGYWDIITFEGNELCWLEEMLMKKTSLLGNASASSSSSYYYMPSTSDAAGLKTLFGEVACSLVLPYNQEGKKGCILLLSNIPDAFTRSDITWAEMLLEKLFGLDPKSNGTS